MKIRKMTLRDLPRAVAISVDIGFPKSDFNIVRSWMRSQSTSSVVAVVDGVVVAYLMYQRCTDGFAILQLRVDPVYQWRGIGRDLMDHLKGKMNPKRWMICVTVEAENMAAIEFLRALRFRAEGFKRKLYAGDRDGVVFRYVVELSDEAFC